MGTIHIPILDRAVGTARDTGENPTLPAGRSLRSLSRLAGQEFAGEDPARSRAGAQNTIQPIPIPHPLIPPL